MISDWLKIDISWSQLQKQRSFKEIESHIPPWISLRLQSVYYRFDKISPEFCIQGRQYYTKYLLRGVKTSLFWRFYPFYSLYVVLDISIWAFCVTLDIKVHFQIQKHESCYMIFICVLGPESTLTILFHFVFNLRINLCLSYNLLFIHGPSANLDVLYETIWL